MYLLTQRLQLIRIDILPYPLHILPIRHYPMLQRIFDLQQPSQFLRSVSDERIPLQSSCQYPQMLRPPHEGREVAFRQILTSVSGSNGTAAVVDDDGGVVEVGHGVRLIRASSCVFLERTRSHRGCR